MYVDASMDLGKSVLVFFQKENNKCQAIKNVKENSGHYPKKVEENGKIYLKEYLKRKILV